MRSYGGARHSMLDQVERFCRLHNIDYERRERALGALVGDSVVIFRAYEEADTLSVVALVAPGRGSDRYRQATPTAERDTAIYMLAVNFKELWGHFSRDHHDSEITFEQAVEVHGGQLTDEQIERSLIVVLYMAERFQPRVLALLSGQMSLQQALSDLDAGSGGSAPAVA